VDRSACLGFANLVAGCGIGEVERHKGFEVVAAGPSFKNSLLVGQCRIGGGDGRDKVGHDDGAAKLGGNVGHGGGQGCAIAQVDVPVVGSGDGEMVHVSVSV